MDIHSAVFRIRIGNFNAINHLSPRFKNLINKPCKSSTKTSQNFRGLDTYLVLFLSIVAALQDLPENKVNQECNNIYPCFLILASPLSMKSFPVMHFAASLQGIQAVHLDRGWIVSALPPQYSILTNSNFYARYTYGNC